MSSGFPDDLFSCFDTKPAEPAPSERNQRSQATPKKNSASSSQKSIKRTIDEAEGDKKDERSESKAAAEDQQNISSKKLKINLSEELNLAEMMPRIQVHKIETQERCTHEVAIPPSVTFTPLKLSDTPPAKEYPFILDPFQKEALICLENNQSVLVSAHTSAGKTVIAEYAVAMSLRDKQRVIYTTPIKALSNQKYRELFEEFKDVGLMTGDVTINPTASCLVMTTEQGNSHKCKEKEIDGRIGYNEFFVVDFDFRMNFLKILRSMLYRGSEVMREVAWVVFDEIHYMRDKDRGVVWEETIILLPDNVHYVFLSATIPNATQFAEWISFLHKQPCHVVYTDFRPTPLQHYIYPAGGEGIHLVVDESNTFKEDNFNKAMAVLRDSGDASKGDQRGRKGGFKGESSCYNIVKMIMERNMAPVIVFSFSRKDCEAYALQMSKLDFNSDEEKKLVDMVFTNALDTLSDEDKHLPQVEHVLPLLRKGIGIHHSGLLPLLKETIEILFGEGLIKALFATETFAMGLNMPARTVLFTSARKFDGKDFRWISSGEYIQMSGRAGRRGLDDKGIVILMIDEKMSPTAGKQILKGQPDALNSAFHLTYNMVLNLLRVEEINPEYMLERSFYQFQNYSTIPGLIDKIKTLEDDYNSRSIENEEQVASYHKIRVLLSSLSAELLSYIQKPQYILPFLQPGRLVKIVNGNDDFGWSVVVNFQKSNKSKTEETEDNTTPQYIIEALVHLSKESARNTKSSGIKPCPPGETGEMAIVPVQLSLISAISEIRLHVHSDLKPLDNRMSMLSRIREVERRYPNGILLLDPIEDMGIKESGLHDVVKKIEAFEHRLHNHPLNKDTDLEKKNSEYADKLRVAADIKALRVELKKKRSLLQMDELKCRKRVLRRLGYATASDVIELKGRVACEISSADALVVTELLFNGVFNNLTPEQSCALLSCFVFQEKASEMPKLADGLSAPLRIMQDTARRIATVSKEAKLEIDEDKYVEDFRPNMMDIVHAWCLGSSFAEICKMSTIFEGSIIRCMRRLEEALREMCQASKAIGNTELENKFAKEQFTGYLAPR